MDCTHKQANSIWNFQPMAYMCVLVETDYGVLTINIDTLLSNKELKYINLPFLNSKS